MKRFETLIGGLFGLAFASLAFLALFAVATLIYKGPAQHGLSAAEVAAKAAVAVPAAAETATTETAAAEPAAAAPEPAVTEPTASAPAAAAVDLAAGEAAFKPCKTCHVIAKDAKPTTGPNLWSVVNRPVAAVEGFKYSEALKALAGKTWDAALLDQFLTKPSAFAKGTKMTFAGLKKPEDRLNLIAWLASQSDTPLAPEALGLAAGAAAPAADAGATTEVAAATDPAAGPYADLADDAVIELAPVPYPEGVTYANPPARSDDEVAKIAAALAALQVEIPTLDYQRARYHPIHFPPRIATASNEECLACHQEILTAKPRDTSPAGVKAADSLAWYQTLDTYAQDQADFHWRHLQSDYAKKVMNLSCNFCHKGNDPREESADMMPLREASSTPAVPEFTLRKMVNPSETCLLCHGAYPAANMGLDGKWHDLRVDMETADAPNGCLTCHAETFRTNRHQVTYLNAANIEEVARAGTSDSCFGCHGGRAWYRISYPYARHPWPGMDTTTVPDWAVGRPTESKPEYQLPTAP